MDELQEFERYLAHLGEGLGHADRQAGLRGYCAGLMAPLARKSVEPMAAHLAPQATRSRHQSLHHFVADSPWSDEQMLLRVAQWVVLAMDFQDGGWWIVDDTGFPKQVTALENATTGVTCNAICPGWVLTPLVQKQVDAKAAEHGLSNEDAKKLLLGEKEPSMQFTTPEELGELAVFFCSAAANNVRGVAWNMDGGWAAQ